MRRIQEKFSRVRQNSFLKGVAVLMSGTAIAQLIPVVAQFFLGRIYTPTLSGPYTAYTSILNITMQISCLRYDYAIVVVDDDEDAGGVFVVSMLFAVTVSVVMAVCMWPFIPQIAGLMNISYAKNTLWLLPLSTFICGTTTALNYFNVRYDKYKTISQSVIIKSIVSVASQVILFYLGAGYWGLILGQLISYFCGNAKMCATLKGRIKKDMFRRDFLIRVAKENVNYPKYMLAGALVNSITLNMLPLASTTLYSAVEGAYVQKANMLLGTPATFVSNAISQVFLKKAATDKHNEHHLEKTFSSVAKWLAVIAIVPFGVLFIWREPLVAGFLGEKWRPMANVLVYLIPLFAVRFVVNPLTSSAIAMGKQKETMIWQFFLLGTVLIPTGIAYACKLPIYAFLAVSAVLMSAAYIIFYRFCYNVVKQAQ